MNYRLKIEKTDDFFRILPKGTFLSDYAQNPGGFTRFFHFDPGQVSEKIASLQNQPFFHRERLIEYLRDYHQSLGAAPETLRNIDDLNDPRALVVMTGQQPGLLTGPMYTIYKTISCLWEARRIEQTFDRRCIPVFWIASEDHNLEEAASIFWPDPEGSRSESGGYSTLSIRPRRGHFKQPVGLLPLDPEGKKLSAFMQNLGTMLSLTTTIHSREVERIIQSTLQDTLARSGTLGEWFSRLMLTFFGPCGLVLFEPDDARVKRLAGPLWEKTVADPLALPRIVDQAGQELERCGYLRQLSSSPSPSPSPSSSPSSSSFSSDRCPFFLYENQPREGATPERVMWEYGAGKPGTSVQRIEGQGGTQTGGQGDGGAGRWVAGDRVAMDRMTRERVIWDGRLFRTQNQDYSPEQLQELLQRQPERISPNVYLRPVFSEFLFPTLCYLAGPGEIGYFAQIKGVYEYFRLKMPIILPRFSATLRDARKAGSGLLQDAYPQERKLNIFYLLNLYGPDFIKTIQSLKIEDYFVHYQIGVKAGTDPLPVAR
jgi:uncharacterized protein YllA (UPF0747 family)